MAETFNDSIDPPVPKPIVDPGLYSKCAHCNWRFYRPICWRHHCRNCGASVCSSCSYLRVQSDPNSRHCNAEHKVECDKRRATMLSRKAFEAVEEVKKD